MSATQVWFKEISDYICALFATEPNTHIWREGDQTAPGPTAEQFRDSPQGTRLVVLPVSLPPISGALPGAGEEIPGIAAQQYTLEAYGLEKWTADSTVFPLSRRQALLNWLLDKIDSWCLDVRGHEIVQPSRFRIHDARVTEVDIDATSPMTEHGWFTAAVRFKVTITQTLPEEVA